MKNETTPNEYDIAAEQFLLKHGIKLRITLSDSKVCPWGTDDRHHYRVTLSKTTGGRLTFDFWGAVADMRAGKAPSEYDVLSCLSSDVHIPETFKDYRSDFGESEDSIKALQAFKRCASFAKRLRAFFTAAEVESLSEIN